MKASLGITAADYLKAMRIRGEMKTAFRRLFADVDVLLSPSRYGPASKLSEPVDQGSWRPAGTDHPGNERADRRRQPGRLSSALLPCGFAGKLPVAVQLVGLPYSENLLIAIGKQYQTRTDWHRKRPSV